MREKRYVDTFVKPEFLEKLKKDMDEENSPKKYYKYKTWLHYANLQGWQNQGWHFGYVNYMGTEQHCTCGLVVDLQEPVTSDIEFGIRELWAGLDLDRVQLQTGHRNLPSLSGISPAILVNFEWVEANGFYVWDGICQVCGAIKKRMDSTGSDLYLRGHNLKCQ